MDSSSFDRLTRLVASTRSRRTFGGVLLGSVAGLLGLNEAAAAPCPRRKKRCRNRCIPKRQCCTKANCRPRGSGKVCRRGRCVCPRGRTLCNGRCVPVASLQTNVQHCGRCRHACPGQGTPNTTVSCVVGKCRLERVFSFTGIDDAQTFIAPTAGTLTVDAHGGGGGSAGAGEFGLPGGSGGRPGLGGGGGMIRGRFAVNPGEDLRIFVGGSGSTGLSGGSDGGGGTSGGNGGGNGHPGQSDGVTRGGGGGGGGGPSDIRRRPYALANRLLGAGGGGGGGGGAAGNGGDGGLGGHGGPGIGGFAGFPGTNPGASGQAGGGGFANTFAADVELLAYQSGVPGSASGAGSVRITFDAT